MYGQIQFLIILKLIPFPKILNSNNEVDLPLYSLQELTFNFYLCTMKLFVKNIEGSVNEVLLESIFRQFGEIVETKIVYDKITWESKGFGFVTFKKKEDAEKAMVGLDGKELVGKKIIVIEAVEKRF